MKRGVGLVFLAVVAGIFTLTINSAFVSADTLNCGNFSYSIPSDAKSSSDFDSAIYGAKMAIDNNTRTHWFGKKDGYPKWIYFDLGNSKCVNGIQVWIYKASTGNTNDAPITMNVQACGDQSCVDGNGWRMLKENWTVSEGGIFVSADFATDSARFIRVYETSGNRNYGTLSEILVSSASVVSGGGGGGGGGSVNAPFCSDTDVTDAYPDGKNYDEKGNTKNESGYVLDDVCCEYDYSGAYVCGGETGHYVNEQFCQNSLMKNKYSPLCKNGCKNGACIPDEVKQCDDTESDFYTAGSMDYCTTRWQGDSENTSLNEVSCVNRGDSVERIDNYYACDHGCNAGACIKITAPDNNGVCKDLIERIANPATLNINGLDYIPNGYGGNYSSSWWINGSEHNFTTYGSSWRVYQNYNQDIYENDYIHSSVYIFDEQYIDLKPWIKEKTNYQICKLDSYWDSTDKENIVYICSWDILNNRQSIDESSSSNREIFWVRKNVVVEFSLSSGRSLTNEEISLIAANKLNDFFNDLRDNQGKYVGWEKLGISYLSREFVSDSLKICPSDVVRPKDTESGEECSPSWNCKIEPVICPEHGYQTRICTDTSCNEKRTERIYCSPGICSGCYVPRWFKGNDNICIPYGFRFEHQTGETAKIEEVTDDENIPVPSESDMRGYLLDIQSEDIAILTLFDKEGIGVNYTLEKGKSVNIILPDWEHGIQAMKLDVKDIVLPTENEKGYVSVKITYLENRQVADKINAYCDFDGQVKQQKVKESDGSWAKCQNNYECDSNLCSGGECVEINDAIKKTKGIGNLFVQILCRLASTFRIQDYNSCVAQYG